MKILRETKIIILKLQDKINKINYDIHIKDIWRENIFLGVCTTVIIFMT
jgi:hypothetical protein